MSDSVEELARRYEEDVEEHYPRSIGLFPIPEYPELESQGMWSSALEFILNTLRYLAPATLLTLFWGQQSFFFTLLKYIDEAFRAIVYSSEEQKQSVLQWLAEAGPTKVEHLDTVWRHGWIVCSVLDSALPGTCAGHPHTKLSLKHAQAIAEHYLGVEPVFSRQELETIDKLSRHQEWKLATYLDRVRQALSKITPPLSKPISQRTLDTTQFTLDYVAKGSGLTVAQLNYKMSFKIYPTAQQALDPGEVTILIRGPKDTYGMTVLPPVLGKAQKIRQKLLGLDTKQNYTENALPLTHGAAYLRTYGRNDMNKTFYVPKTVYDIEIEVDKRVDHVKVWYTATLEGKYEISITSRGQNIVGSPFRVKASNNIIAMLEKENFNLEDGEEIDIVDVKTDRKVVLRIVDFVTEKMLLRENGTLEKISNEEAKMLMSTDIEKETSESTTEIRYHVTKRNKFKQIAHKAMIMNRVCNIFNKLIENKRDKTKDNETFMSKRILIPDIVNSTFNDIKNPFMLSDNMDKYIVPENISVSIKTEISKPTKGRDSVNSDDKKEYMRKPEEITYSASPDSLERIPEEEQIEDDFSVDRLTPISSNNPFLADDFEVEKKMGTFVKTEYERNNSQSEETRDTTIKIIVEDSPSQSPVKTNPFIEKDVREIERPKTPVYKIIAGEPVDREDSPYVNPKIEQLINETFTNEFVNPFLTNEFQSNQHYDNTPVTNFIIGAPVSTQSVKTPLFNSETDMGSLVRTVQDIELQSGHRYLDDNASSLPTNISKHEQPVSSLHSLDSNLTDTINDSNASVSSDNHLDENRAETQSNRDYSPRKDTWDSAYVSIDDNNSSPDNNNNESTTMSDSFSKQKISPSESCVLKENELSKMGPAEREIWQTCTNLKETSHILDEKQDRWERRPLFTPIIEESDRSISSGTRDTSLKHTEVDSVSMAFAELNDVYEEYFPKSDNIQSNVSVSTTETYDTGVESASETLSDVTRHIKKDKEGKISEVQANVTESDSVSQSLRHKSNEYPKRKDETKFCDVQKNNIVLEKKRYWDERIRQIEEKTEETAKLQKKRRFSAKQLKHDSLSKRKGKQIVKNFLNADEGQRNEITTTTKPVNRASDNLVKDKAEEKLVGKWKKYWDDKLESEHSDIIERCSTIKSVKTMSKAIEDKNTKHSTNDQETTDEISKLPIKQELPEEEVFKAFETSPKRFFGTSRKRILNKIDTFLGKPSDIEENNSVTLSEVNPDSGLVSSRISLFHKMTNTEPLVWASKKTQSLHNINTRKDSENSITSTEATIEENTMTKLENDTKTTESTAPVKDDKLREKRLIMHQKSFNQTIEVIDSEMKETKEPKTPIIYTKIYNKPQYIETYKNTLRKSSISKSEMDIFNKVPDTDNSLDKHKSCDELPKINVKSFISLYENVSKSSIDSKPVKKINSTDSQNHWHSISVTTDADNKTNATTKNLEKSKSSSAITSKYKTNIPESLSVESLEIKSDNLADKSKDKETTYISLSDIELEIVENISDKESTPERTGLPHIEYKNRFNKAKQFFKSLEELREVKKPKKLNECELLLINKSTESLEPEPEKQKRKKLKTKSHSMPSSELAKYWNEMNLKDDTKLVKISEKFHVDDLFSDVMEGRLSRQGSLRGIPHKKAVLEAFRSMENVSDKLTPYEISKSNDTDFSNERVSHAQSYLSEYPYLPTTDPSKYHSRVDIKASGLITLKELLEKKKMRRNSVPDLRLNAKFSAEL